MTRLLFRERYLESAVMICNIIFNGKRYIVLEKRAKDIRQGGEISFPGGKKDKSDIDFKNTAIRETVEELGIDENNIKNVSYFGTLVSATGVILECFECYLDIIEKEKFKINKAEVEKLLFVPLDFFIQNKPIRKQIKAYNKSLEDLSKYNIPEKYCKEWSLPDRSIHIYQYDNEAIWGMTAEVIMDYIKIKMENR